MQGVARKVRIEWAGAGYSQGAFKLRRTPVFCRSLLAGDFTFHRLTTSWIARKQAPASGQIRLILEANWNYQVINRGNYRRDLFASNGVTQSVQTWLCAAAERFGWRRHAFVAMRNQRSENPAGELPAGFLPLPRLRLFVATQFAHGQPLRARGTQPPKRGCTYGKPSVKNSITGRNTAVAPRQSDG